MDKLLALPDERKKIIAAYLRRFDENVRIGIMFNLPKELRRHVVYEDPDDFEEEGYYLGPLVDDTIEMGYSPRNAHYRWVRDLLMDIAINLDRSVAQSEVSGKYTKAASSRPVKAARR